MFSVNNFLLSKVLSYKNKIIISSGGGGKKYGMENKIWVFERSIPYNILN
jgi:hypothetical protein